MTFKIDQFTISGYNKLVAEASDIGFKFCKTITIGDRNFIFTHTDSDANGEDVYGYWYRELNGERKALVIND